MEGNVEMNSASVQPRTPVHRLQRRYPFRKPAGICRDELTKEHRRRFQNNNDDDRDGGEGHDHNEPGVIR